MKNRKKTEFEALKDIWYSKLHDEGFRDIEHDDNSSNSGIPRSLNYSDDTLRQITQDYYCMAYHFLNSHSFETELEKAIWEYHTEGLTVREIAKTINNLPPLKTSKTNVWSIVKRLEIIMKSLYLSR